MPVYLIADVKVNDESWIPEYAAKAHDIVHRHSGKYLALLEFPSLDAIRACVDDPDYTPFRQARGDGTVSRFDVIDNTDVGGTIPYLRKG